jgi:hypothetical protein
VQDGSAGYTTAAVKHHAAESGKMLPLKVLWFQYVVLEVSLYSERELREEQVDLKEFS